MSLGSLYTKTAGVFGSSDPPWYSTSVPYKHPSFEEQGIYGIGSRLAIPALILANLGLGAYAMARSNKAKKVLTQPDAKSIIKSVGADRKTPVVFHPDVRGNAFYLAADEADTSLTTSKDRALHELGKLRVDPKVLVGAKQHGAILADPTSHGGIIAHEAGHAKDYQQPGGKSHWPYRLSRFLAPLLGGGAGAAAGYFTGNPYLGALAGAGAGGLVGFPVLKDEYTASDYAEKALGAGAIKKKDTEAVASDQRSRLRAAYLTYLLSTLGVGAASGLGGGLFRTGTRGLEYPFGIHK